MTALLEATGLPRTRSRLTTALQSELKRLLMTSRRRARRCAAL